MKKHRLLLSFFICLLLAACQSRSVDPAAPLSKEQWLARDVDSLKRTAAVGDLIVRLGDDFLSYYIKQMNEKDPSFSHAGVVVEKDGQKRVAHITPDSADKDGIAYIPIDSFINPSKTLQCALYRYNITPEEKLKAASIIEEFRQHNAIFDRLYDLKTDDKLYCSEMISKAFAKATDNRLHFKTVTASPNMRPLLVKYFKRQLSPEIIAKRPILTIDNLYLVPQCTRIMALTLKTLPGQ